MNSKSSSLLSLMIASATVLLALTSGAASAADNFTLRSQATPHQRAQYAKSYLRAVAPANHGAELYGNALLTAPIGSNVSQDASDFELLVLQTVNNLKAIKWPAWLTPQMKSVLQSTSAVAVDLQDVATPSVSITSAEQSELIGASFNEKTAANSVRKLLGLSTVK